MSMKKQSDLREIIENLQNQRYRKALTYLNKDQHHELYAEIERLASTEDAVSNYTDRLIGEFSKKLSEQKEEEREEG